MSQLIKCTNCGKDLVWCPNYDKGENDDTEETGNYLHYSELVTLKLSDCTKPEV